MKVLFISKKGLASNLARLIKKEGHEVLFFMESKKLDNVFDGIVDKTDNWEKELHWVGKDGLIVFDDNGYGKKQDELRVQGYSVFGGCELADKLEYDREFTQDIFNKYDIQTRTVKSFKNLPDAISFITENPTKWILKRDGDNSKFVTYAGERDDARDVLEILNNYAREEKLRDAPISIQKKAEGIEIGVGRYFNGKNFVGPIEMNLEHPRLFAGEIGPFTDEMGTVAWYTDKERRVYKETLAKIEPFLREIDFRGDIGINCIVNETDLVALETTARIGCPIVHLQTEIHESGWAEFMKAIADQEDFILKWRKGAGVVFSISVPPFPFEKHFDTDVCSGLTIYMDELTEKEQKHVHLDEVAYNKDEARYYISRQTDGFVLYVTGFGKKVTKARKDALNIIKKIKIPKMFYRIDIGEKFDKVDFKKLKKWGWI